VTRIDTVIIGGGQAGLAMSRCLLDRGVAHVVLERGRVGERWRSERWESLRLLTPNWQTRLPGFRYTGADPDGFMGMPEFTRFLEQYAASFGAPVVTGATVRTVARVPEGFSISTDRGTWRARHVVVATGYSDVPAVPRAASALHPGLCQVVPTAYRRPGQLPDGGVLVVGASATGVQLAEEIHASGRPVTLAVGRHLRLPRTYRGRDILWWLDAMGILGEGIDCVADSQASRRQPSLQLTGRDAARPLDLGVLHRQGVRLVGRLLDARGTRASFDDDLIATMSAADLKLAQLRGRIDRFVTERGLSADVAPAEPFAPTWPAAFDAAAESLDLARAGIRTVVWATGFTRRYPWLHVPVLDRSGDIRHTGGVTPVPGLYVLGMHFQRRRNSAFIDGVGADAADLADRIAPARRSGSTAARAPIASTQPTRRRPAARYDAVVVGARCAGSATAMLLARQGMKVLLVEQGARGADTLSTLALMRGGVLQLARWGLLDAVRASGTPAVRSTTFHYEDDEVRIAITPRDGVDSLCAPRRTVLDPLLADAAAAAGADVRYRTRLTAVQRNASGRVTGVTVASGAVPMEVRAGIVIGADGVHSSVAARVGAEPYRVGAHASSVIYGFADGLPSDGYHWHYAPGVSAGVIPTTGGQTLIFASAPRERFMRELRLDLAAGFMAVLEAAAPALASTVRLAPPRTLRGFAGMPGYFRPAAGPGWALVGDAGFFKDPITAHGITDAFRDAELLARAVLEGTPQALAGYQETRDDLSGTLFTVTDAIASFTWDLPGVQSLHRALSEEMARETRHLLTLDAPLSRCDVVRATA
jgi:putative flavoprotein involved in K+ transport